MSLCWCFNIMLLTIEILILGNEFQEGLRFHKKTKDNLKWLNQDNKKLKEIKTCNLRKGMFLFLFFNLFTDIM